MRIIDLKLIRTANFDTVQELCTDAATRHRMVGLIGYTGAGKTTALKQFYLSEPEVYYVKCKNIMNRKQFFASILKELGANVGGTVFDMVNRIVDEFNTKENPLLIRRCRETFAHACTGFARFEGCHKRKFGDYPFRLRIF